MAIPLATTTITVLRVAADATRDPYAPQPAATAVASGIRAHLSLGLGSETTAGGSQEVVTWRLACDPFDAGLHHLDEVRNEKSGTVYEVVFSETREGMGMDHFQAGLRQVSGVAGGRGEQG